MENNSAEFQKQKVSDTVRLTATILIIPREVVLNRPLNECEVPQQIKIVSPTSLRIPLDTKLDLSFIIPEFTVDIFSKFCSCNPNKNLELIEGQLFVHSPMSSISDGIALEVGRQIGNWNIVNALDGGCGASATNFIVVPGPPPTIRKPDSWWMDRVRYGPLLPDQNNQLPGVPDFVVEVISPNDHLLDQRTKCGDWVNWGVDLAMLIDYLAHDTYLYATTASGLLPMGFPFAYVLGVTEQRIPWPALPALNANGVQKGPALVVPLPAGSLMAQAVAFGVNHATFSLN